MRVMLIDDCPKILEMTAQLLRLHGHDVFEFADPRAALQAARLETCAPDVIVTDYQMPGLNGIELAKRIAGVQPLIPIILYSACDPTALYHANKNSGNHIKLIFQKPVKSEDLHNGILAVCLEAAGNRLIMESCSCGFPDKNITHACPHIKLEVKY